jgi:transposase
MNTKKQEKAKARAAVILRVRSGAITATQGAEILGVSRKTYYQWEQRGLQGMMQELTDEEPGRPEEPSDPHQEAMEKENTTLKARITELEQVSEIRAVMRELDAMRARQDIKKKHN